MARTVILRDDGGEHRVTIGEKNQVIVDRATAVLKGGPTDAAKAGPETIAAVTIAPGVVRVGEGAGGTAWVASAGDVRWVYFDGDLFEIEVLTPANRRRSGSAHGLLSAPMPATVVRVDVVPGATVRRGDTLIILEAMKMELPIRTPSDGVVTAIHCRPGDLVQPGVPLVDLE